MKLTDKQKAKVEIHILTMMREIDCITYDIFGHDARGCDNEMDILVRHKKELKQMLNKHFDKGAREKEQREEEFTSQFENTNPAT